MKTKNTLKVLGPFGLALLLAQPDVRAHHSTTHNQNPNPPSPLLTVPIVNFEIGSLILPMDGCYARMSFMGNTELDNVVKVTYENAAATLSTAVCNGTSDKDDAIIPTYSLVQRLIRDGITVHWAIKGAKTSFNDWDFKVAKVGGSPVLHTYKGGATNTRFSGLVEIRYAGAPFVIAANQADTARSLMATYNQTSPGVDYSKIDVHVAQVAFSAPIYASLNTLPKLAIINTTDAGTNLTGQPTGFNNTVDSVDGAIMDDMEGTFFRYYTIAEVNAGALITNNVDLVWVPPFGISGAATPAQTTFLSKLSAYVDQGGHILFQGEAIETLEGHGTFAGSYTQAEVPHLAFMTGSSSGLLIDGIAAAYDNGDSGGAANESAIGSDFSDPASQWGGMVWTGIGGSKHSWQPRTDFSYLDGVRRMVFSQHTTSDPERRWDFAAWRYKDNDKTKGVVYYLGGENWRPVTASGFRLLLNTIFVVAAAGGVKEVSRSTPIGFNFSGTDAIVQGSYEFVASATPTVVTSPADLATFKYPFEAGHMRAVRASDLTAGGKFFGDSTITPLFDAANFIPTMTDPAGCSSEFQGSCRTVWTTTKKSCRLGDPCVRVPMNTSTSGTLGPIMAQVIPGAGSTLTTDAHYDELIKRVLGFNAAGVFVPKLGGVDRSTVSIVPKSQLVTGAGDRPTMIYFGATDGMLHAVCGEKKPLKGCDEIGRELWAYVPRVSLPEMRLNTARIDGSPHVAEMFGAFRVPGQREFRTVLFFQTGDGDSSHEAVRPATYALDISDPQAPQVLWEYTLDAATSAGSHPATVDLGRGTDIVAGQIKIGLDNKQVALVATNNGGTGSAAHMVTAIDAETGRTIWEHKYIYPAARVGANPNVPDSGMPGGAVGVDQKTSGFITDVAFGTLYGDIWLLNPTTGKSKFTGSPGGTCTVTTEALNEPDPCTPAWIFGSDFHPFGATPAIFNDGTSQHIVMGSGGYNDQEGSSWNGGDNQYGVAISMATTQLDLPLPAPEPAVNTTASAAPRLKFVRGFGVGENAFSQALILGDQVFFTTNTTNINGTTFGTTGGSSGKAYAMNFTATTVATDGLAAGASGLANVGTQTFGGSGDKQESSFVANSAADAGVSGTNGSKLTRKLWLRTE